LPRTANNQHPLLPATALPAFLFTASSPACSHCQFFDARTHRKFVTFFFAPLVVLLALFFLHAAVDHRSRRAATLSLIRSLFLVTAPDYYPHRRAPASTLTATYLNANPARSAAP